MGLRIKSEGLKEGSLTRGFTLVELAIALMVIGLLIGGVLKGQELIENARVTAAVRQINDFDTAIMMFRNTYYALPGDMMNPAARITDCNDAPCNIPGTGNGEIHQSLADDAHEPSNAWWHLERAGLISGMNQSGGRYNASPRNPWGGHTYLLHRDHQINAGTSLHRYAFGVQQDNVSPRLPLAAIRRIDGKMDDGKPASGRVTLAIHSSADPVCYDTTTLEYSTQNLQRCYITITSDSAN